MNNNENMLQSKVASLLSSEGYKVTKDTLQILRIGRANKIVRGDKEWTYEPKPHPDIMEGEDWVTSRGRVYWTANGVEKLRGILRK